jgi:thiosulfate/3-mercaptopyruvate sulfurtransferase
MEPLVTPEWLDRESAAPDLRILDATAHLPSAGRDAAAEFAAGHIPHARFLDLASLKDAGSPVPNALPTPAQFAERMRALGVAPGDRVVLYDDSAVKTSARAWWMLRMNGIEDVAILDGGLAAWRAEVRPLQTGMPAVRPADYPAPAADWSRVRDKAAMLANIDAPAEQVLDARDAGRFSGATPDTVHNLPGGHIPGARNLPFVEVFDEDGRYLRGPTLRAAFEGAGIDLDRPIVTSCGSGVTATVLLFALHLLGKDDTALYDGSWLEWGADPGTPKQTGQSGTDPLTRSP